MEQSGLDIRSAFWAKMLGSDYLSERDDQLTHVFLSTTEADVVVGDEQLSNHMRLCKGCPQSAVCVSIETLVLRQPEHGPISLILCPSVQISAT